MADNVSASFVTEMLSQDNVDADLEVIIRDAAGSLYSGVFAITGVTHSIGKPLTNVTGALIATGSLLFTFMMAMAW